MSQAHLIRNRLRTPRAAALAGILFSIFLIASQLLIWIPSKVEYAVLHSASVLKDYPLLIVALLPVPQSPLTIVTVNHTPLLVQGYEFQRWPNMPPRASISGLVLSRR